MITLNTNLAWKIIRQTKIREHGPLCPYRTSKGKLFCSCAVYEALKITSKLIEESK